MLKLIPIADRLFIVNQNGTLILEKAQSDNKRLPSPKLTKPPLFLVVMYN